VSVTGDPSRGSHQRFPLGVNLTWLVPGVVGGSEEYTMRLLDAVAEPVESTISITLYGRGELFEAYPEIAAKYRTEAMPSVGSKAGRIALEQTWLAGKARSDRAVHHAGGTVPFVRRQPAILTVHDPQPLDMPENFHPAKRRWLERVLPYSVNAAALVVCPSRFTADRLHTLLGTPEEKLRVVLHGHRSPSSAGQPLSTAGSVGPSSVGRGRYLLYPAIAYPHKRHIDAVRMLSNLGGEYDDVDLIFTGRPGPELHDVLSEAARLGIGARVKALGRIPATDLERLYRDANALVFPSAYEGFGNPALEAMSLGCPVIVSNAGALPEVVGDAGMVYPVGDVGALTAAVAKLLSDRTLSEDFRRRGRERARAFDACIAAGQLAEVYGEIAAR
jgi:alpha-1,3-rhamnosyl/mannosyltransferase